jgi:hypothetical protein
MPLATAAPVPPATPAPSATPLYRFVFIPTPAPREAPPAQPGAPEIHEIDITDSTLYAPGDLHVRVLTNAPVVSVTAGTMGRDITIPGQRPGVFAFDGYIPNVPDFVRGRSFDVDFVASTADGRTTTVTLALVIK